MPQAYVYSETDIFKNLYTSTTRKIGEALIDDPPPTLLPIVVDGLVTNTTITPAKKLFRRGVISKGNTMQIAV